jgi:hypothetical protein
MRTGVRQFAWRRVMTGALPAQFQLIEEADRYQTREQSERADANDRDEAADRLNGFQDDRRDNDDDQRGEGGVEEAPRRRALPCGIHPLAPAFSLGRSDAAIVRLGVASPYGRAARYGPRIPYAWPR